MAVSDAQNDKAGAPTKAESLVECHVTAIFAPLTAGITDFGYSRCAKRSRLPPASAMPVAVPALVQT